MNKVLVLAVHPDDETLGCGGTILKYKARGDRVYWLIATDIKKDYGFNKEKVLERESEIKSVNQMYNFNGVYRLGLPTTKIDKLSRKELVDMIAKVFNKIKPNIVYLPSKYDIHSDHRILFETAYSCTKIFRYPFVKKILMMETISETEFAPSLKDSTFIPNYFVDISNFLSRKLEIMKIYKDEINICPFPRSIKNIKALATFRGSMSGCRYAEGFMLLKEIL